MANVATVSGGQGRTGGINPLLGGPPPAAATSSVGGFTAPGSAATSGGYGDKGMSLRVGVIALLAVGLITLLHKQGFRSLHTV
jgi:hypothetical protein